MMGLIESEKADYASFKRAMLAVGLYILMGGIIIMAVVLSSHNTEASQAQYDEVNAYISNSKDVGELVTCHLSDGVLTRGEYEQIVGLKKASEKEDDKNSN